MQLEDSTMNVSSRQMVEYVSDTPHFSSPLVKITGGVRGVQGWKTQGKKSTGTGYMEPPQCQFVMLSGTISSCTQGLRKLAQP